MHVLGPDGWTEGFLDATPVAGGVRVLVDQQAALFPVEGEYFVRQRDMAMLLAYLRMLGPRRVLRKVRSRGDEAARNDSWVSIGRGRVVGSDGAERAVVFVSPGGPRGAERLVLSERLLSADTAGPVPPEHRGRHNSSADEASIRRSGLSDGAVAELRAAGGWNAEEGTDPGVSEATLAAIGAAVATLTESSSTPPRPAESAVQERAGREVGSGRPRYHLFGYGQYAKTQVIPNLGRHLDLAVVHEIDPLQIGASPAVPPVWDTSPVPRLDEEQIEIAAIAGYHHTHAPLAAELIRAGTRHVVVEKPIATSREQLSELVAAMKANPQAKVHGAFQRRYSPLNDLLRTDLGEGPVSMAATVYEVPLPSRHWYRWPVVGNAVVSNGCHWIDHFLFLNDFSAVTRSTAEVLGNQIAMTIALENGASAVISLRHEGSPRRGVRDLTQFWRGEATVTMEDLSTYRAESGYREVRSKSVHRYLAHETMYRQIAERIAADASGDSVESLTASVTATLDLADLVEKAR